MSSEIIAVEKYEVLEISRHNFSLQLGKVAKQSEQILDSNKIDSLAAHAQGDMTHIYGEYLQLFETENCPPIVIAMESV